MSYGRFQPNMRSAATSQQLASQADDLRAQAQVAAVTEQEFSRQALANVYNIARDANLAAGRQLPRDAQVRLIDYTRRLDGILTAGQSVSYAVPVPLMSSEITGYTKQRTYNASLIQQAFTSADDIVSKAVQGAAAEAAAIVEMAYQTASPDAPDGALSPQVDASVAAIHTALSIGQKPADVLQRAMAAGDTLLVYALLSSDVGMRLLTVMGADRAGLLRTYAKQLLTDAVPDQNGVTPMDKITFPGAPLLRLQDGDQALAKLPGLAQAYYSSMVARCKQLLASSIVQANMAGSL